MGKRISKEEYARRVCIVREHFPTMTERMIVARFDIPLTSIHRIVVKYGFVHSPEFQRKLTEDSVRRMRALHADKNVQKKINDIKRRQYIMEKFRVLSGLPQKTNIRVKVLSKHLNCARANLRSRHNYFVVKGDDPLVICYDSKTRRTPNEQYYSEKYGFKFIQAEG